MANWIQTLQAAGDTFSGGIESVIRDELYKREVGMSEQQKKMHDAYRNATLAQRKAEFELEQKKFAAANKPKPKTPKDLLEERKMRSYNLLSPEEQKRVDFPELFKAEDEAKKKAAVDAEKNKGLDSKYMKDAQSRLNDILDRQHKANKEAEERFDKLSTKEQKKNPLVLPFPDAPVSVSPDDVIAYADSLKVVEQTGAWPENEQEVTFETQDDIEEWILEHPEDDYFLQTKEYQGLPRRQ